jgi:hypothetical protein
MTSGVGPVPRNGQNSATLPFKNFQVSDVPSNLDYTFRARIGCLGSRAGPKPDL